MFFFGYEGLKKTLTAVMPDPQHAPIVHMMSASGGEIVSLVESHSIATQKYESLLCVEPKEKKMWVLNERNVKKKGTQWRPKFREL